MLLLLYGKRILHRLVHTYLQSDKEEGPNLSKPVTVSSSFSMKDNTEMRKTTGAQKDKKEKRDIQVLFEFRLKNLLLHLSKFVK